MRVLFWTGLAILLLGIASFFIDVPRRESEGIKAGNVEFGVQVRHSERLPVWVGALLIGGGIVMMVTGGRRAAA